MIKMQTRQEKINHQTRKHQQQAFEYKYQAARKAIEKRIISVNQYRVCGVKKS